jgi:hypothetical protein
MCFAFLPPLHLHRHEAHQVLTGRRANRPLAPFGLVFGGRVGDPRARRGNRGSGFARARKQSQAVIVGGVSLEAAPPARQDDAETASIIVNGRKGLKGRDMQA